MSDKTNQNSNGEAVAVVKKGPEQGHSMLVQMAGKENAEFRQKLRAKLSTLDSLTDGMSISANYLKFKNEGESKRGLFLGYTDYEASDDTTGEVKMLDAILLMDQQEKLFINAGVQLVTTFQRAGVPAGAPVEITFSEEVKAGRGTVKLYDVRLLTETDGNENA